MVVLTDELLEAFFDTDLSSTFRLDREVAVPVVENTSGLLGGLMSTILTDDNKKLFNRLADEIGKSIGKHHVRLLNSIIVVHHLDDLYWPTLGRESAVDRKSWPRPVAGRYEGVCCPEQLGLLHLLPNTIIHCRFAERNKACDIVGLLAIGTIYPDRRTLIVVDVDTDPRYARTEGIRRRSSK